MVYVFYDVSAIKMNAIIQGECLSTTVVRLGTTSTPFRLRPEGRGRGRRCRHELYTNVMDGIVQIGDEADRLNPLN